MVLVSRESRRISTRQEAESRLTLIRVLCFCVVLVDEESHHVSVRPRLEVGRRLTGVVPCVVLASEENRRISLPPKLEGNQR